MIMWLKIKIFFECVTCLSIADYNETNLFSPQYDGRFCAKLLFIIETISFNNDEYLVS